MRYPAIALLIPIFQSCIGNSLYAQFPTIELQAISQPAAQLGTTIDLKVSAGSRTDELSDLVFSDSGILAESVKEPAKLLSDASISTGAFKVTLSDSTPRGLVDVRALGRFGVSNPRSLLVTQQPIHAVATDHASLSTAIAWRPSTIFLSHCQPLKRNYYSLTMKSGDTLRAVCYAKPLDSLAIPSMILLGPDRSELASGRAIANWPAEIEHTASRDGEYHVIINDFLYQGGSQHAYVFEAAVRSPQAAIQVLELDALLRPTLESRPPAADHDSALLDHHASFHEKHLISQDLSLKKDQNLWIEVFSQQCGQLTDPRLIIYRLPDGTGTSEQSPRQLVEQDDPPAIGDVVKIFSQDPQLLWKAPEDGNYRFVLLDNESGRRPPDATAVRLLIRSAKPSFNLYAYIPYPANDLNTSRPTGSNLMRGGAESVRLLLQRQAGFIDAVTVTAEGLPTGVAASPLIIPAGSNAGSITLTCTENATAWNGALRFVGHSMTAETLTAESQAATLLWARSPTHNAIQSRLCDQLRLSIGEQDTAPIGIQLGGDSVHEVAQGAKLSLPIKVIRRAGGNAACLLRPKDLPPKTSLSDVTIAADKNDGTAELTIAGDTPLGEYTFWMQNETKVKWRDNPQSLVREESYLTKLNEQLALTSDAAQRSAIETAITATSARVDELKKATAERELTVWIPSDSVRLKVVAASQ